VLFQTNEKPKKTRKQYDSIKTYVSKTSLKIYLQAQYFKLVVDEGKKTMVLTPKIYCVRNISAQKYATKVESRAFLILSNYAKLCFFRQKNTASFIQQCNWNV
jgi:hypothetical protein